MANQDLQQNTTTSHDFGCQKPQRAAPVRLEEWERLKPRICALYEEHSLKEVLQILEEQFEFVVTKRQLIYKLETWGVRKYKVKDVPALLHHDFSNTDIIHTPNPEPAVTASPNICLAKKLAADFCAAVADDGIAFNLYLELFRSASVELNVDAVYQDNLLISCARSAQHPGDADMVRRMAATYNGGSESSIGPFFLAILESYATLREAILKEFLDQRLEHILSGIPGEQDLPSFLGTSFLAATPFLTCLIRRLGRHGEGSASTHLTRQLLGQVLSTQPHLTVKQNDWVDRSWLRSCLEWCREQLQNNLSIPEDVKDLDARSSHYLQRDNLQLFCALWHASLGQLQREGNLPPWCELCEKDMSISHADLLLTASWMLGVQPIPSASNLENSSVEDDGNSMSVLRRANVNATAIAEWPEHRLWAYFLHVLAWLHEPVSYTKQDEAFEETYLPRTRAYVSSILKIQLLVPKAE